MIPPSVSSSSSSSLNSPPRHHHHNSSSSSSSSNRSLKYDLQVEVSKTILPTRLCDYFLILGPGKVIANKNNYTSSNDHHYHQSSSSAFYHPTIISSFPDNSFYKKQKSIIPDLLGNNWLLGKIPLFTLNFCSNRNCDRYEVQ